MAGRGLRAVAATRRRAVDEERGGARGTRRNDQRRGRDQCAEQTTPSWTHLGTASVPLQGISRDPNPQGRA